MYQTEKINGGNIYIVSIQKDTNSDKLYVPVYKEDNNLQLSFDDTLTSCLKLFGSPPEKYVLLQTAGKTLYTEEGTYDSDTQSWEKASYIDHMFRIFRIDKVGHVMNIAFGETDTASGNTIYKFKFEDKTNEFKSIVNHTIEKAIAYNSTAVYYLNQFKQDYKFPIRIVCQQSNFSMTLSNQYGPSFLDRMNNVLSNVARQITQMGISESALETIAKSLQNMQIPFLPDFPVNMIGDLMHKAEEFRKSHPGHIVSGILKGDRIVFPRVWQGSSYDNSYSIKFTIFADDASNADTSNTKRLLCMLYQLTTLLVLSTPRATENSYFFTYPYVFQGELVGIRKFKAGVITNLNISFDPEQSIINPLGDYKCINIEFTIMDLYNTLLTLENTLADSTDLDQLLVPTVQDWIDYIAPYLYPVSE